MSKEREWYDNLDLDERLELDRRIYELELDGHSEDKAIEICYRDRTDPFGM